MFTEIRSDGSVRSIYAMESNTRLKLLLSSIGGDNDDVRNSRNGRNGRRSRWRNNKKSGNRNSDNTTYSKQESMRILRKRRPQQSRLLYIHQRERPIVLFALTFLKLFGFFSPEKNSIFTMMRPSRHDNSTNTLLITTYEVSK